MVTTCDLCARSYAPGREGQVDWYEAWAELNGLAPLTKQIRQLMKRRLWRRAVLVLSAGSFVQANIAEAPFRGAAE
jgi:hypothetical protein